MFVVVAAAAAAAADTAAAGVVAAFVVIIILISYCRAHQLNYITAKWNGFVLIYYKVLMYCTESILASVWNDVTITFCQIGNFTISIYWSNYIVIKW